MKKKYLIELIIFILLLVLEIIVVAVMYSEAASAQSPDVYITSIIALFTNIDVLYGVFLLIIHGNWRR